MWLEYIKLYINDLLSERLSCLSEEVDDKDTVVVEVGDDGFAVGLEADATRRVKMLPHGDVQSVLHQELAGRGEKLLITDIVQNLNTFSQFIGTL